MDDLTLESESELELLELESEILNLNRQLKKKLDFTVQRKAKTPNRKHYFGR